MSDQLSFAPEDIIAAAKAVDGLEDFGDQSHEEPLRRLLWSLEHEADLNEMGRHAMHQRMVDILATRLRVQAWLSRYPEILDEVIESPLVIVGLPRTGTTMLHRTIAADRRMYAPLWYEVRFPCPDLDWDFTLEGDRRISEAKAEVQAMVDANPDLLAIHPMDAMGPDEDIMLLEQSFYSFNCQALVNIPSFDAWIEAQDHTPGYEYLKLMLQFLQWQKKRSGQQAQRWTLKAPHHLHYMDLVFKVFPDAKVVQSHRDPVETIPSLASLIAGVWVIYSDSADPKVVGEQWARKFANGMRKTMAVRQELGDEAFLDLWFKDTVSQPLVEIEKVYQFLGMDLTDEARSEMAKWQDFNRRELRPPHAYTLEQFGFTEDGLKQQFQEYRAAFIER
ncbi:sulfotransferase [Parahaliea sp. F7430]|uniref:Sulfotransferase n=1 Tax=Sediminihaliea albiluteola TaxID=2758564 RepID=A0A7W2TW25_9GAMM|nr:sulfotransferase [Sediminihaliea albiluteola]MBA6412919.1 sulfotransferase [Sediminihaliea albiluteola]